MIDSIGPELRHHLNIGHIMWSTDYPHTGSDWLDADRRPAAAPARC